MDNNIDGFVARLLFLVYFVGNSWVILLCSWVIFILLGNNLETLRSREKPLFKGLCPIYRKASKKAGDGNRTHLF